jgi:succinate dehydrogenase hydrophobic anchor subunit
MTQRLLYYYVIYIIINSKSNVYNLAHIDVSNHVKTPWSKVVLLLIYVMALLFEGHDGIGN